MSQQEIPREIYAAHRKLSLCSARFLEFVSHHPASLKRANFNALLSDRQFGYFRFQPWPTFINQETKKEVTGAAMKIFNLIKSLPGRLFDYHPLKISRYYEFPEDETRWMLHSLDDTCMRYPLARGDFIFSPAAGLKCIEFNIHASLGGWELDLLEPLYTSVSITSEFLREYEVQLKKNTFFPILLKHIGEQALERFAPHRDEEINMAIAFPEYNSSEPLADNRLIHLAKSYDLWKKNHGIKGEIVPCDLDHLGVKDNCVMFKENRIHVLVETYFGRMPLLIMEAVKRKNLLIYNGPIGLLLTNKLNMALLSEYQDSNIFTPDEKETIREYIPWTRKMVPGFTTYGTKRINLEQFVISNRERLVIKPANNYGGVDVFTGFAAPADQWKQQVERAFLEKNWVVQEYVPSCSYLYQVGEQGCSPHRLVWGFFVFGSRYAGGFVRLQPEKGHKGVINTHLGAEESIILEVDE
jgi:hypothetical protein